MKSVQATNEDFVYDDNWDDEIVLGHSRGRYGFDGAGSLAPLQALYLEAISRNDIKTVCRCLAEGVDVNTQRRNGNPPLMMATAYAGRFLFEKIISCGVGIDTTDYCGVAPLSVAASYDFSKKMKVLLRQGAALEIADPVFNVTALNRAAIDGSFRCLSLLVAAGADLEHRTVDQQTPLLNAARRHPDCCLYLLEQGAKADVQDIKGRTALHYLACINFFGPSQMDLQQKKLKAARLLIERGCPIVRDVCGRTPMDYAEAQEQKDLNFLEIVKSASSQPTVLTRHCLRSFKTREYF